MNETGREIRNPERGLIYENPDLSVQYRLTRVYLKQENRRGAAYRATRVGK
jgi:hypothetical protein